MYIGSLQKGGAERVMVNLAAYFHAEGYRVTLVTTYIAREEYEVPHAAWAVSGNGTYQAQVVETADQYISVDPHGGEEGGIARVFSAAKLDGLSRFAGFRARYDTLRGIWKDLQPDLILSFSGKNNIMAIQTARGLSIPVVVSVRGRPAREYAGRAMDLSMRLFFPKAAGIVLQTRGAMEYFPKRIQKKACILPNSVNPAFMRPIYTGEREHTIVSVGRLDSNKNQEQLIRAFAKTAGADPSYELRLYGDGPSRAQLEELCRELQIGDRVRFMGLVSDVPEQIAKAGIFVLPSKTEGMPNALIEAMSLGIPCISNDCPYGPSELIEPGVNGLLTPVGDVDAMAGCLAELMNDPALAASMGERASKVQEMYSPERINRLWKDYFDKIMMQ